MRPALLVALCVFALVGWQGITTAGRLGGDDAGEHVAYAQYLDEHGRIPSKSENYEYATPPLFHLVHVPTGSHLAKLPLRKRCKTLARELATFKVNWDASVPDEVPGPEWSRALDAIRRANGAAHGSPFAGRKEEGHG